MRNKYNFYTPEIFHSLYPPRVTGGAMFLRLVPKPFLNVLLDFLCVIFFRFTNTPLLFLFRPIRSD